MLALPSRRGMPPLARTSRRRLLQSAAGLGAGIGLAGLAGSALAAAPGVLVAPNRLAVARRQFADFPWQARHGLDGAAHQAAFETLAAEGYRPVRISGYSVNGVAYYASVWEQSPGPAWATRHGIDAATYQAEFEYWAGQGYRLVDVSGFELNGADYYAAIWYAGADWPWEARHGLSNGDYQAVVDQLSAAGYRPLHVAGYTVNGQDRYATIWDASPGPAWVARHGLDGERYQAEFDGLVAAGFRPVDISGYHVGGTDYFAAIFEEESGVAWAARHGIDEFAYQATFEDLANQGFRPRAISGYGSIGQARYAAIWDEVAPTVVVTSSGPDQVAQQYMLDSGVPGVSVAIARDGRLVYAKGFGYADPAAGELTTAEHRFRIASVAKPITAVAIMRLVEDGWIRLDDLVFGDDGWLGTQYGSQPYPEFMEEITIQHLLEHTSGGWSNQVDDPMFAEPWLFGDEFISWVIDNTGPGLRFSLNATPGTAYDYSNFGYSLLGRIIESVTGQSYDGFVRDAILAPCGVYDMEIAGDTLADRRPGEVVYDGTNAPASYGQPYEIPVARMDAHGGWIATATDLLRFATRVDRFATVADILADGTIAVMVTPSAANPPLDADHPGYAKGWAVNIFDNWWHNGALAGTESILVRSSDGICWAAIANGNGINLDAMGWAMVEQLAAEGWPEGEPL